MAFSKTQAAILAAFMASTTAFSTSYIQYGIDSVISQVNFPLQFVSTSIQDGWNTFSPLISAGIDDATLTTGSTLQTTKSRKKKFSQQKNILYPAVKLAKHVMRKGKSSKVQSKTTSPVTEPVDPLYQLFTSADKNRDAKLDNEEVTEILHRLGYSWLKEKQIGGVIRHADKDENGFLDFPEISRTCQKSFFIKCM